MAGHTLLQRLLPTNYQEEKEKFFTDFSYDPQFIYDEPFGADTLKKYGETRPEITKVAQQIVSDAYEGSSEQELLTEDGVIIDQNQVDEMVNIFLKKNSLEDRVKVSWSSTYLSRATMASYTLKLKTIAEFRSIDTLSMIYHELGTHALRRINYEQQPWYKKKNVFGFSNYLKTEEGLASIHSLLPKAKKSAHSVALRYLAADFAQHHSFSQLWEFLTPYIDDLEKRWMVVVRQKRGVTNTAQPGGFTKDIVYFHGMLQVLKWLSKNDYDPTLLYIGKVALTDIKRAMSINPDFSPKVPHFFSERKDEYAQHVRDIIQQNNLSNFL